MKLKIKNVAPDFVLPDQEGKKHHLSDYRGKWVLLYFYPKDNTPGCTREACVFRDVFLEIKKCNAEILGISVDSVKSHNNFAGKYKLPFIILSDEKKEVVKLYGVWGKKKFMGHEYIGTFRNSYLIDPKGKIAKTYESVKPDNHAAEVLLDLIEFQKK